jgi:predicted dehydrogenase
MPGVELAGVASRSQASGEKLKREFGFETAFTDFERMLDEIHPDAVFVAVSHAISVDVAQAVIKRNVPCMLEKPVAYTAAEARELAGLARRHGTLNLVGVNRRFHSVIQQAWLAVLQQGPVRGVLVEAHEPILDYRSRLAFEGWLYDRWLIANSIHGIDLLRMIGGEVQAVEGFGVAVAEPLGDHFSVAVRHEGSVLGTFIAHWNSVGGMSVKIYGDGVIAELTTLEGGFVRYASGRRIALKPDDADKLFKPGLLAQNVAFLQSVCDGYQAAWPASDLNDNCRTMELIEWILKTCPAAKLPVAEAVSRP